MNRFEHLITKLSEECAEISQQCSKVLCFGLGDVYGPEGLSNLERLVGEIRDLQGVLEMLEDENVLPRVVWVCDAKAVEAKKVKVEHYISYARSRGTLI